MSGSQGCWLIVGEGVLISEGMRGGVEGYWGVEVGVQGVEAVRYCCEEAGILGLIQPRGLGLKWALLSPVSFLESPTWLSYSAFLHESSMQCFL
jgi:hypothetical protein